MSTYAWFVIYYDNPLAIYRIALKMFSLLNAVCKLNLELHGLQ